jgi:hypothetical protein
MIHIKQFIDKIASMESRQNRDVVMSLTDARALRDEITKLIIDKHNSPKSNAPDEVINVEMKGNKW